MSTRRRVTAWGLVLGVLTVWLLSAVAAAAGWAPRVGATSTTPDTVGYAGSQAPVVVVGVPGLSWDRVDPGFTPALTALAARGGTAALVARGTHEVTCPADFWLTVGAGQRAATDLPGCGDAPEGTAYPVDEVVTGGAIDPGRWAAWQQAAQGRALGPRLGTLADTLTGAGTCVSGYGLAVLGAAGGDGTPASSLPTPDGQVLPSADTLDPACRVHLLAVQPDGRGLTGVDQAVGTLQAGLVDRWPESTLVVVGSGHVDGSPDAQVLTVHTAPATGPGGTPGPDSTPTQGGGATLTSGSTQQQSLVQLTDLAPTLLHLAGVDPPGHLTGAPITASTAEAGVTGAAGGEPGHVRLARDLGAGVSQAKALAPWVLGALAVLVLPLLLAALLLRARPFVTALAVLGMAVPVATFTAGLVPWWRAGQPGLVLTAAVLVGAAALAAVALAGPWRRHPLGPPAVVAAVTLAILGADVLTSSRLGLVSVLGLQPVTAGRFYGMGNVGFGALLGAVLVLLAVVLSWSGPRRGEAVALVLLLGVGSTVLTAAPQGGADAGGVVPLVSVTGLLALSAAGRRWSPGVVLLLALLGVIVTGTVMVLDWARGPDARTHLGDFVQSVADGEAVGIVTRKLDQSLGILVSYPVSWLAVLALAAVAAVVALRPRFTDALWQHRGLRPAAAAGLVGMVLAWALNDSGIAAVALTLTLLIAAGLSVGAAGRSPSAGPGPG